MTLNVPQPHAEKQTKLWAQAAVDVEYNSHC